jgi:hypothetical protein
MSDLDRNIGSLGQELLHKYSSLGGAVGALAGDGRTHVHYNRHAVLVGRPEHPAQSLDVFGVIQLDVRVAKVKLDPTSELRIG